MIRVINHGGPGRFCFVREADWPMASFKTAVEPEATRIGAFTVWPTIFEILEKEERDLIIQFEPDKSSARAARVSTRKNYYLHVIIVKPKK